MTKTVALLDDAVRFRGDATIGTRVREIAASCGIHYEWLYKLRNGTIQDPGILRLEALYWRLKELERSERWAKRRRAEEAVA